MSVTNASMASMQSFATMPVIPVALILTCIILLFGFLMFKYGRAFIVGASILTPILLGFWHSKSSIIKYNAGNTGQLKWTLITLGFIGFSLMLGLILSTTKTYKFYEKKYKW